MSSSNGGSNAAGGAVAVQPHEGTTTGTNNNNSEDTPSSPSSSGEVIFRAQVWLDNPNNMQRVLDCLDNPQIQFVDMYLQEAFLANVDLEDLIELMTKIGHLPQLERLDISCPLHHPGGPTAATPVSALVACLRNANKLTHLLLVNLQLTGSREEFATWATTTQTCVPRLHLVVLAELELSETDNDNTTTASSISLLDPLVEALSSMLALGHVLITGRKRLGGLLPSSLSALLSSRSLRDLCISQLDITDVHLIAMVPAMTKNLSLQELDLEFGTGCMGVQGATALSKILQDNQCLDELTLRMMQQQEQRTTIVGREGATIVSRRRLGTMANNAAAADKKIMDDARHERNVIVANGVAKSRLSKFEWHGDDESLQSKGGQEPFVELLKDNVFLEAATLLTLSGEQPLKETVDFYLKLNALGRGQVLQRPAQPMPPPQPPVPFPDQRPHRSCMRKPSKRRSHKYCWPTNSGDSKNGGSNNDKTKNCKSNDLQWIDMLAKVSEDVPKLFYFLSINPALCANSQTAAAAACQESTATSTRHKNDKKRRKGGEAGSSASKRTRLYRKVKYQRVSYK